MKTPSFLLLLMIFVIAPLSAQTDSDQQTLTFHTSTSLVLLDVSAQDQKTGLPVSELKREDFQVFDNGHPVPIATFDSGGQDSARPVALWFVVICNMQNMAHIRSGAFAGHEALFRSALDDLFKNDTVGVAHWCDNGDAELDLPPTEDRDLAIRKLAEALDSIPFIGPNGSRVGELAAQEMFRAIIRDAYSKNRQPLPVVVILHGDQTGMPRKELDNIVNDFLETSGVVFGIKDSSVVDGPPLYSEQGHIFHYMADATGGRYFSVPQNQYAETLRSIILQLHQRYELGFKPPSVDGKRHKLKVELVGNAREAYGKARLKYRPEYIPTDTPPKWRR